MKKRKENFENRYINKKMIRRKKVINVCMCERKREIRKNVWYKARK